MDSPALLSTTSLASLAFGLNVFFSIPAIADSLLTDGDVYDHPDHVVQSCESSFRGGICDDTCLNLWGSYCVNRHDKPHGLSWHCRNGCRRRVGLNKHCKSCGSDCAHGNCERHVTPVHTQPQLEDMNPTTEPTEKVSTDSTTSSQTVPTHTSKPPFPAPHPLSRTVDPAPEPAAADVPPHSTQTVPAEVFVPSAPATRVPADKPTTKENRMEPEIPKNALPFGLDDVGIDVPLPPMPVVDNSLRTASKQNRSTGTIRLIEQLNRASQTR